MKLEKETMKKLMFLIVFAILTYFLCHQLSVILNFTGKIFNLFLPFVLGLCIAFVLNVPTTLLEEKLFKVKKIKSKKKRELIRTISVILSLILFIIIIAFVLFLVIPELARTIASFANNVPAMFDDIQNWFEKIANRYPDLQKQIASLDWEDITTSVTTFLKTSVSGMLNSSITVITSIVSGIASFIMGIVFSVYILTQKEGLGRQVKKLMNAYLPQKTVQRILEIQQISSRTFSKFITGQCLEAVILGAMFFLVMTIFKFPYTLLISVLVTVTALIPIFGAIIAMIIGAILIAVSNPIQALWFILLFLVLQQIEGNFIYPKVVGKSVGLPAIWVMLAVMVGGGAFGIVGMLVSVPLSSILYSLLKDNVNKQLKKKEV